MTYTIEQKLTPNRWVGALDWGYDVIHTTEGTNSLGWLLNPDSQVSYTYLIPKSGPKIYKLVGPNDAAWHAGAVCDPITTPLYEGVNPNRRSRGIAVEGHARDVMTPFQLGTVLDLIRKGGKPWCGHFHLAGCNRTDPGAANMSLLTAELEGNMLKDDERQWLYEIWLMGHQTKNLLQSHFKTEGTIFTASSPMRFGAAPERERDQKGTWDGPGAEPLTAPHRKRKAGKRS